MSKIFYLKPGHLSWDECNYLVDNETIQIALEPSAVADINLSRAVVEKIVAKKQVVYGINTGLGLLANRIISEEKLHTLQYHALVSHACGIGPALSKRITRMILLLKINSLSMGYSGVRVELIERLIFFYNSQLLPIIPEKGSVGASGDLVPLAHMSLPLIGEGYFNYKNDVLTAVDGLNKFGLAPLTLEPKEGLALVNGLQVSQAIALNALWQTEVVFHAAILAGSLTTEAMSACLVPFDDRIQQVKGHAAQIQVATLFRQIFQGSQVNRDQASLNKPVQNPYSIRCQPQVMGAILHQINWVKETLTVEMNSVSDNPLVFAKDEDIISGGNFHGEMIAMMADNLALSIAEIGSLSERRIALLIDEKFSGLPAFLVKDNGLNSGFMMPQVTAAACASDNKALAHPHVVDSIPTSANQEDHVSMATSAALRLSSMIDNTATIVAIELISAAQGADFLNVDKLAPVTQKLHQLIRSKVKFYDVDRVHAPDIAIIKESVLAGEYANIVQH
ncbi:histidine ammonia-lyase [Legionella sp. W05-934-2]|jgi:histidine ammonia-lyase|uniref:histidine ammonia-lyase n=1 Tax=Legionella sp. W05-934-2 TaxID=1198649 RepID=UPI003461DBE7